ncbi:hypothetical protein D3C80_1883890 [compost metagenome]
MMSERERTALDLMLEILHVTCVGLSLELMHQMSCPLMFPRLPEGCLRLLFSIERSIVEELQQRHSKRTLEDKVIFLMVLIY